MQKPFAAVFVISLFTGCGEPRCVNTNPAFGKYPLDGPEYNAELARELRRQNNSGLSFWINRYISINNKHYMEVRVHGDNLCAEMVFEIGTVKRLENFITIAGESYSGAELKGVTYSVDSAGGNIRFVMTGLTSIID